MSDETRKVLIELIQALRERGILAGAACEGWMDRLQKERSLLSRGHAALMERLNALQVDQDQPVPAHGQVWREPNGQKVVLTTVVAQSMSGEAPEDWTYICDRAHEETDENGDPSPDFSYTCRGNQWCKCLQ